MRMPGHAVRTSLESNKSSLVLSSELKCLLPNLRHECITQRYTKMWPDKSPTFNSLTPRGDSVAQFRFISIVYYILTCL